MTISVLPREIVHSIFEYLEAETLFQASLVSKAWLDAFSQAAIWKVNIQKIGLSIPQTECNLRTLYIKEIKRRERLRKDAERKKRLRENACHTMSQVRDLYCCACYMMIPLAVFIPIAFITVTAALYRDAVVRKESTPTECIVLSHHVKQVACAEEFCMEGTVLCVSVSPMQNRTFSTSCNSSACLTDFFAEYKNGTVVALNDPFMPIGSIVAIVVLGASAALSILLPVSTAICCFIRKKWKKESRSFEV